MGVYSAVFWRTIVRAALGELCDKTWFSTILLVAWCPFVSIRFGRNLHFQHILVFFGALSALMLWVLVLAVGAVLGASATMAIDFVGACFVFVLAAKAFLDLTSSNASEELDREREKMSHRSDTGSEPEIAWNTLSYGTALAEPTPSDTEAPAVSSNDKTTGGFFEAPPPDELPSSVKYAMSFLVPFLVNFALEAEDKSMFVMLEGDHTGVDFAFGCLLGYTLVLLIAVATGYLLERMTAESKVLYLVVFIYFSLCFLNVTLAVLQVPSLST